MKTIIKPMEIDISTLKTIEGMQPFIDVLEIRNMSKDDFIEKHASGTLRKNHRIGFASNSQYREERIAYTFGWEFQCLPESRVTAGKPITEGDCGACTETGWHTERMISLSAFGDKFQPAYIQAETESGRFEGLGIVVTETSAEWVNPGNVVFAIVAEWDETEKKFVSRNNPF